MTMIPPDGVGANYGMVDIADTDWYHLVGINPIPWKASQVGGRRKNGSPVVYKPEELKNYQESIKSELEWCTAVDYERIELQFYFWRRLDTLDRQSGRKATDHRADATNLQKALEDALQGVLFANDRNVVHVNTWLMEQGPEVTPRILIGLSEATIMPLFVSWPVEPVVTIDNAPQVADFDVKGLF